MNSHTIFDELDQAIEQMMADSNGGKPVVGDEVEELLDIASELRHLPRPDFKMQLRAELEWQRWSPTARVGTKAASRRALDAEANVMPTLSGTGYGMYPIHRANFAASVALHAAALLIVVGLSAFVVHNHVKEVPEVRVMPLVGTYQPMAAAANKKSGGGGGGDNDKLQTSAGTPPKASMLQQMAPPVVVRPKDEAKIMAEPTITADLKLAESSNVGDQLSKLTVPSAGTGTGSGVGSGSGGGSGPGRGRGFGPGDGFGNGGGETGGSGRITSPKIIFSPDPEFSDEARKVKHQGVVVMTVLVGTDGRIHHAEITRSLGMGLDEKALETIKLWKFEPARTADGTPVAVYASIEVNFRLY